MKFSSSIATAMVLAAGTTSNSVQAVQELYEMEPSVLQSLLPPSLYWNDSKSMQDFSVSLDDAFVTPAEASNFTETARLDEVTMFFTELAEASPYVQLQEIASLANGIPLWLVTVSGEQQFEPANMTKPTILATAGIHPGESSGVNAGMMFLRNLVMKEEYADLLMAVNWLLVPVLNPQGYLRQSVNGRINQHGPNTSGRRANGAWQNLNRDFGKLDTPEVQAVVGLMRDYDLSFYTDLHSTDGMNYQPDVTWCDNGDAGLSPAIYQWLRAEMNPSLTTFLEEEYGHKTGVCYYANDPMDPTAGYYPYFSDGAAYSTNYADHRQIPAYLLEIHSLKPNHQRVLGAYAYLLGLTQVIANATDNGLRDAIATDRAARVDPVPIAWDYDSPAPQVEWDIFEYEIVPNEMLGIDQIIWSNTPLTITVEQSTRSTPYMPPVRPYAYIIPAVWQEAIDKLAMHGIPMMELTEDVTVSSVTQYRTEGASLKRLREGRPEISGGDAVNKEENVTRSYSAGDVVVMTDNPLGTLAVALLEPVGESSFFLWGFFSARLQSHEYPENYIMIPIAERMLEESDAIREEWETYKASDEFVNETSAVLDWFFRRSAFYDDDAYVYPVGILYSDDVELPMKAYEVDEDVIVLVDSVDEEEAPADDDGMAEPTMEDDGVPVEREGGDGRRRALLRHSS